MDVVESRGNARESGSVSHAHLHQSRGEPSASPEFPKETLPSLREYPLPGPYRGACVGVVVAHMTPDAPAIKQKPMRSRIFFLRAAPAPESG
jgi:hypothetical protein